MEFDSRIPALLVAILLLGLLATASPAPAVAPPESGDRFPRLACVDPILLRVETRAGHGAGTPTWMRIENVADQYAFAMQALGVDPGEPD